jgi:hypothetical protein
MRTYCEALAQSTDRPNPVIATEVVETLRRDDPDLLTGWLNARAGSVVTDYLDSIDRSTRARARYGAASRGFSELVTRHQDGDSTGLAAFEARYVVDTEGTRRRVADMTGADHLYVSHRYQVSSRRTAFLARVHQAVAEKVGYRRTEEVFSPEQYAAMFSGPG